MPTTDSILRNHDKIENQMRTKSRPIQANVVLDYEDDGDFVTMLTNLAEQDEMVLQCLEEELSSFYDQEIAYYSAVESDYKEPATYKTMLKRPPSERSAWLEGCKKEIADFARRQVWRVIKMHQFPKGRKLICPK